MKLGAARLDLDSIFAEMNAIRDEKFEKLQSNQLGSEVGEVQILHTEIPHSTMIV